MRGEKELVGEVLRVPLIWGEGGRESGSGWVWGCGGGGGQWRGQRDVVFPAAGCHWRGGLRGTRHSPLLDATAEADLEEEPILSFNFHLYDDPFLWPLTSVKTLYLVFSNMAGD
jgi:hypothetical protein